MEARATYRSAGISRGLVGFVLIIVAGALIALGAFGASTRATSSSGVQTSSVHPAAGTVLRQDYPPNASEMGILPAAGTVLRQDNPSVTSATSDGAAQSQCDLINNRNKAC